MNFVEKFKYIIENEKKNGIDEVKNAAWKQITELYNLNDHRTTQTMKNHWKRKNI